MDDWMHAEVQESDGLARLRQFSMNKRQDGREIEFIITVREHLPGDDCSRRFVAQADKQTNQRSAPFTPMGWGASLSAALAECVRAVHRFPYEGDDG